MHGKLSLNDTPDCLVIQTDLDIRGRICFVAANKLFVVNVNGEYPSILELEVITSRERLDRPKMLLQGIGKWIACYRCSRFFLVGVSEQSLKHAGEFLNVFLLLLNIIVI